MRLPAVAFRPTSKLRAELDALGTTGRTLGNVETVRWLAPNAESRNGLSMAIPPVFDAYVTYDEGDEDDEARLARQKRLVRLLSDFGSQPWWVGYLDTGAHDVVLKHAPRVEIYVPGWEYVLVQADPREILDWRDTLPDLIFPADHSWLLSMLWDDDFTYVGGPVALMNAIEDDPLVRAQRVARS